MSWLCTAELSWIYWATKYMIGGDDLMSEVCMKFCLRNSLTVNRLVAASKL